MNALQAWQSFKNDVRNNFISVLRDEHESILKDNLISHGAFVMGYESGTNNNVALYSQMFDLDNRMFLYGYSYGLLKTISKDDVITPLRQYDSVIEASTDIKELLDSGIDGIVVNAIEGSSSVLLAVPQKLLEKALFSLENNKLDESNRCCYIQPNADPNVAYARVLECLSKFQVEIADERYDYEKANNRFLEINKEAVKSLKLFSEEQKESAQPLREKARQKLNEITQAIIKLSPMTF